MGKLNYTNRKVSGGKLAQIVARDITKRITAKEGLTRQIDEFDISNKEIDDAGLDDIARALLAAAGKQTPSSPFVLEEVCLKANKIGAEGIASFALVIQSPSSEIRSLDLSHNSIEIRTDKDASAWQVFLRSFSQCTSLRRLDLSGNNLGRKGFEILSKVYASEVGVVVCETTGRATTCGLQSIPYICLADTGLDDVGSTYLSYVLESHKLVHELLPWVAQAKSGPQTHQLEAYDNVDGCDGIIWKPNKELGSNGVKVLELSEIARIARKEMEDLSITDNQLMNASTIVDQPESSRATGRRRSLGDSLADADGSFQSNASGVVYDLPRARSKIQLDLIKDEGLRHNDLWMSAFKMLRYTRAILLGKDLASTSLPAGFSGAIWTDIIAYAADAHEVLSDNQKLSIMKWGASRDKLLELRNLRGKHRSQQIYKELEGLGCLAYGI